MRLKKSAALGAVLVMGLAVASTANGVQYRTNAQDRGQATKGIESARTIVEATKTVPGKEIQSSSISQVAIPFQTIRRETDLLFVGQRHVLTYGVEGVLQKTVTTYFESGRVAKHVTTQKVLRKPVPEVILVGQKVRPKTVGNAHLAGRSESGFNVLKELTVVATAYVGGGRTATGVEAQPGVIAVDPSVIPLGTKLYIPGIGEAVAADTGGAIRGDRIDICMSSTWQADQWGIRTIQIYEIQ